MRPLLLLSFALTFCFSASAQWRFGVKGGVGVAKFILVEEMQPFLYDSYETGWHRKVQVGLTSEYEMSKTCSIRAGLLIDGKGSVIETVSWHDTSKRKFELHYIELPLELIYKKKLTENSLFYSGAGVYFARAARGIETGEGRSIDQSYGVAREVNFANTNASQAFPTVIKPFDWGFSLTAGVERKKLQLGLTYNLSGSTILPNTKIYRLNYKNATATLSFAYFIY